MIEILPGNVFTHVLYDKWGASPLKNNLNEKMKVDIPGAQYLWAVKCGDSDGQARLWEDLLDDQGNHYGVRIRSGLIPRLIDLLERNNVQWKPGHDNRGLFSQYQLQPTQIKLRLYQHAAIAAAFGNSGRFGWWPRGVIAVATGGGKTEIAVAMYEMNPRATFFLVHRKDLLIQAKERFEKYGHTVGIIGDGKFNPEPGINIATMQTLASVFKDPMSSRGLVLAALVSDCKQVFFDESHLMASNEEKGNQFVGVSDFFDVPFRWGLTATPFLRDQYDNLLLESVTGQALYRISTMELVNLGFLTRPKVIVRKVPDKINLPMNWSRDKSNKARAAHWRKVETAGIKLHQGRTALIIEEVDKGPWPVLVLVKTMEQAEFIQHMYGLNHTGELQILSGKDKIDVRRTAVERLQSGDLKFLIVTTLFDEGIDIPELRKVILAGGGKSDVKTIQRVGRTVRKAPGKGEAIIIDFDDAHHPMLAKHFKARMNVFIEQGFEVEHE